MAGKRALGELQTAVPRNARTYPVHTEIVRNALIAAADQMKETMIRTAVSPIIFDGLDFGAALFDRRVRLLAQSHTLLIFMGTLGFCVEAAVESIGGEGELGPGDVLLFNLPYGSGSHAQDAAIVMPVFLRG